MTMYFKGGKGIANPVDINGNVIKPGDILTTDYGDYEQYMHKPAPEYMKIDPFYLVEQGNGFLFAESIECCTFTVDKDARFYLHDFRFKHCALVKSLPTHSPKPEQPVPPTSELKTA